MELCTVGICEDDKRYRDIMVRMVRNNKISEERVRIFTCSDGNSFLAASGTADVDILFMDVMLPDGSGYDVVKHFRERNKRALVNFCTSVGYPDSETFKLDVFRYIRKDEPGEKIERQIAEIFEEYRRRFRRRTFYVGEDRISLSATGIMYCEKRKRGTLIRLREGEEIVVTEHLDEIYRRLSGCGFARPHSSYIVNMDHIALVNRKRICLDDGEELSVAAKKWKTFQEDFKDFVFCQYG